MKGKYGYLMGAAVAAAMTFGAAQADAAAISGSVSFTGAVQGYASQGGASAPFSTANFLDFFSLAATPGVGDIYATPGTISGDFTSSISPMEMGTIKDLTIDPFGAAIADFWVLGDFSFDLETLSITTQNASGIFLSGTGTLSGIGYDDTPGVWTFSVQSGGNATVSFSATSDATAVPAPAAIGLLGLGLIGLGAAARRRNA